MVEPPKKTAEPIEPELVESEGGGEAGDPEIVDLEILTASEESEDRIDGSESIEPEVIDSELLDDPEDSADDLDVAEESSSTGIVTTDLLQRYMTEARRYPVLSREEEKKLAIRYVEEEDVDAAYSLVTANLRLVVMVAREYVKASRNLLDLVQEGNIGLMEALKRFDPYRGVRFPSYAVWWVRAYIIRYLINNWRMVKVGTTQAQRKLFFNLQKEKEKLERQGIIPEARLIAQRLDVKEREVIEMDQRMSSRDLSVDAPRRDGEGGSLLDILPDRTVDTETEVADAQFQSRVSSALQEFGATLKDKEKRIFESRLVSSEPLTLQEIGEEYGISRERVRQIEARIKKKLKAFLVEEVGDIEEGLGP